jgi:hypothetical protein
MKPLAKNILEKILPYTNCFKMQPNALLIWQNFMIAKVGVRHDKSEHKRCSRSS